MNRIILIILGIFLLSFGIALLCDVSYNNEVESLDFYLLSGMVHFHNFNIGVIYIICGLIALGGLFTIRFSKCIAYLM